MAATGKARSLVVGGLVCGIKSVEYIKFSDTNINTCTMSAELSKSH